MYCLTSEKEIVSFLKLVSANKTFGGRYYRIMGEDNTRYIFIMRPQELINIVVHQYTSYESKDGERASLGEDMLNAGFGKGVHKF